MGIFKRTGGSGRGKNTGKDMAEEIGMERSGNIMRPEVEIETEIETGTETGEGTEVNTEIRIDAQPFLSKIEFSPQRGKRRRVDIFLFGGERPQTKNPPSVRTCIFYSVIAVDINRIHARRDQPCDPVAPACAKSPADELNLGSGSKRYM
jgi:hypothetical protein